MMCAVCRRAARSWGFAPALIGIDAAPLALCSRRCQDIAAARKGMVDPSAHERAALEHASLEAGAYVEALGTTQLEHWSAAQWHTLIAVAVSAFQDALREAQANEPSAAADADPPF